MLVVDASSIVEILTVNPIQIQPLTTRIRRAEWLSAPALIDYEVHNVLRKMVLRKEIGKHLAVTSLLTYWKLRIGRYELTEEMSVRMSELAGNMSSYDAAYVALAEHLKVPLITADRRLAQATQQRSTITVESYIS
jgi:predicted nucleic acid-binding protein